MRRDNSELETGFLSESGTHLRNKDYFAYTALDDMACWVVARGLDSDQEVESAELAVKSVLGQFMQKPSLSRFRIRRYLREAHRLLQAESHRVRLKASLVLIVTDYARMVYAVAGNARLYHFRNGHLHMRSKDQSLSQQMADREEIAEDVLDHHEERHNLLSYLGTPNEFRPYISRKLPLYDGDVLLLTTPGLWEGVNQAEMLDALEEAKEPIAFVDTLEEVLLSKQRREVNNYTAAAVFVNKVFKTDPQKKWRMIKRVAILLFILVLAGGGAIVYKAREAARMAEAVAGIVQHEQDGDAFIEDGDYVQALREYSEARNDAIKVKDKVHESLLTKKLRITQLIVDGDSLWKEEQYGEALEKYQKAQKEMKGRDDFDQEALAEKIEKAESFLRVQQWMKEGDLRLDAQDHAGAADFYQKARKLALESSFASAEKELRMKLDDVALKQSGLEKEKRQLDGEKLEKKGDDSYAAEDFAGAIQSYTMAQEIYQEIGLLEKVLGMERKITKAEEKLNPPVVPVPAVSHALPAANPSTEPTSASAVPTSESTLPTSEPTAPAPEASEPPADIAAQGAPGGGEGHAAHPDQGKEATSP